MSENSPVEKLIAYLKSSEIVLDVMPLNEDLRAIDYAEVQIQIKERSFIIPVFDEYRDVQRDNPVLWFHLILEACEYFEEADSFATWRFDIGLKDDEMVADIYQRLKQTVPLLREQICQSPKAVSDYDIQFNTGIAQDLRACTRADLSN